MADKADLLGQLRIDRGTPPEPAKRSRRAAWWLSTGVIISAFCVGAWLALGGRGRQPETVAAVAPAEQAPIDRPPIRAGSSLDASGYVVARRQATVSSKITGKVLMVLIEEGQRVEKDQIIARLDDTNANAALAQTLAEVEQANARLQAAQVAFDNAGPVYRRNEQQMVAGFLSAQSFDLAKATYDQARTALVVAKSDVATAEAAMAVARRNGEDTVVRAPFAGVVTVKAAQPGEIVSPISAGGGFTRTGIGTIVDMESLEVEVDVNESFINRVTPGQPTTVNLNAYPDWQIPASVIAVVPTADRAKATVKVRIGFKEKDARILPEMGARVSFLNSENEVAKATAPT